MNSPPKVPKYRWPPNTEPVSDWISWPALLVGFAVFVSFLVWRLRS